MYGKLEEKRIRRKRQIWKKDKEIEDMD